MRRVSGTAGERKVGDNMALPFGVSEDGEERTDEEADILPGDSSGEEGLGKVNGWGRYEGFGEQSSWLGKYPLGYSSILYPEQGGMLY
jgi:hypothetical protein